MPLTGFVGEARAVVIRAMVASSSEMLASWLLMGSSHTRAARRAFAPHASQGSG